jgi:hypothetical protein
VTYSGEFAPLLGPCNCQGCGEPLWWARRQSRRMGVVVPLTTWRDEVGLIHRCPNLPGRLALAGRAWDNDAAEYSGPIAHNAQRPSVRLYSEREGVGYSGVQTE